MSSPRFDLNTMEINLKKNMKELKYLARYHNCERIVDDLNAVDADIENLIETVSTAHRRIRNDAGELKGLSEEKFNEISKKIPATRAVYLDIIDSNIETVRQPFPEHVQGKVKLITDSIRTNLTVSLEHLSEMYSHYEKHSDYGITAHQSRCLMM